MNLPILCIAIPTFNRSTFLNALLDSIVISIQNIDQKYVQFIEVIISNNSSSDDTLIVLEKYSEIFDNHNLSYKFYNQKKNIGFDLNYLFCLKKATARYVHIIGDDDCVSLDYFEKILKVLNSKDKL